jgi:hypothetical protein
MINTEKTKSNLKFLTDNIVRNPLEHKKYFLENQNIDLGITELVDAINSIEVLVTISSSQGSLMENYGEYYSKNPYVWFQVLDNQFQVGNGLMASLVGEFSEEVKCSVDYCSEFDFFDDEDGEVVIEENGLVNLTFCIELSMTRFSCSETKLNKDTKKLLSI